jgi:hypothetical protein
MIPASQPITGNRVADRQREKAKRNGDHDEIQHEMLPPSAEIVIKRLCAKQEFAIDQQSRRLQPRLTFGYLPLWVYVFEGQMSPNL